MQEHCTCSKIISLPSKEIERILPFFQKKFGASMHFLQNFFGTFVLNIALPLKKSLKHIFWRTFWRTLRLLQNHFTSLKKFFARTLHLLQIFFGGNILCINSSKLQFLQFFFRMNCISNKKTKPNLKSHNILKIFECWMKCKCNDVLLILQFLNLTSKK